MFLPAVNPSAAQANRGSRLQPAQGQDWERHLQVPSLQPSPAQLCSAWFAPQSTGKSSVWDLGGALLAAGRERKCPAW